MILPGRSPPVTTTDRCSLGGHEADAGAEVRFGADRPTVHGVASADDDLGTPASVRAELLAALEQSQSSADRNRVTQAGVFLTRVVGRLRRPDAPMGPNAVKAAKLTKKVTGRFGFDDEVAEVFVALAAAIADEAADMYADELADAARKGVGATGRFAWASNVADFAKVRARLGTSFVDDVVPAVATGLAGFVPGLALRRPLSHPSMAVGAAVAGGLAATAMVGTSAVPVALALAVVTEAAETYAQGSVLAAKFRAEGHEPTAAELLDELAAIAGDGVFGRTRPEAARMLRTAALPRLADTLERRVGVRVASLATVIGPAVVEGGLATWGIVKASRHRIRREGDALPPPDQG